MAVDVWGSFGQGYRLGGDAGATRRDARAFQDGGLDSVRDRAFETGDLDTGFGVQMEQRRQRQFDDDRLDAAFQRLTQFGGFATSALRRAQSLPPEQRAHFFNQPHIRQRFEAFGFSPQQYDEGVARLSNPETAEEEFAQLYSAFQGNIDWSAVGNQMIGVDQTTGETIEGGDLPEQPAEWRAGYGRAYRINPDGSTEYGGRIPQAPVGGAAGGMGTIPSGYRLTPNGELEPIPGGPAAARVQTAEGRRMGALLSSLTAGSNVLNAISDAERLSENSGLGGGTGINALFSVVPGTTAHNLSAVVDTIQANIGFDRLNEMRMNSPTGGALGNVTERELALLQAVVASLRTSQNNEQFRRNLQRVRDQYVRSMQNIRAAYEQDFGSLDGGEMPVPSGGQTTDPADDLDAREQELLRLREELTRGGR